MRRLALLSLLGLLACSHVVGPCVRRETVTIETNCEDGGRSGSARLPRPVGN